MEETACATVFRVESRRGFWIGRGLGALAMAVASAFYLRAGGTVVGAMGVALFGGLALYALRQSLRTGPRLALSQDGVDAADLGVDVIAWRDIEHVQVFGSHEAPFIAFHVREPAPYLARMPWWTRVVVRLLGAQGLPPFSINLIGVDRDVGEIGQRARALLAKAGAGAAAFNSGAGQAAKPFG